MSSPTNLSLPSRKALLAAMLVLSCSAAWSQNATSTKIEWLTAIPCEERFAELLPAQPELGLALYRFSCPGSPPKLVSAKRMALVAAWSSRAPLARAQRPDMAELSAQPPAWIASNQQAPLDPQTAERVQARRPIRAGEPLLARDFEPRRLWIGGESISLSLSQGAVTTTVQASAQGVGRWGERASAKTDQGKVFFGVASMCSSGPCLRVGSP